MMVPRSAVVILSLAGALAPGVGGAAEPSTGGAAVSPEPVVPTAVVPLADRTLATLPIANADMIVEVGGGIWVRTDDGRVVHVDPATDSIVAEVKVDTTSDPYHYCQALGTDGTDLWSCSAAGGEEDPTIAIVQVDAETHAVLRTVPIDMSFEQFLLPFVDGRIWALVDGGAALVGIDVETGTPTASLPLDARCTQLAAFDGALLAACAADDALLLIDPAGPTVAGRTAIDGVIDVAAGPDDVWVARERAVSRLDPDTLAVVADHGPLPGVADLEVDGDAVWIRHGVGFLFRLDRVTGEVTEQIVPDGAGMSPGSVHASGDSVWVTANDEGVLIRVSATPR